jgi:hypothetical protein
LYQDARWPTSARIFYGSLLAIVAIPSLVHARLSGISPTAALYTALVVAVPAAVCEWRARRMGIVVGAEGLVLVRALNRTFVPWEDIERFERRDYGIWGEARLCIKRDRRTFSKFDVPTLVLTPTRSHWTWWFQPARLRSQRGDVVDPVGFLEEKLADARRRGRPHQD